MIGERHLDLKQRGKQASSLCLRKSEGDRNEESETRLLLIKDREVFPKRNKGRGIWMI